MTKKELVELLAPYDDDTVLLTGPEYNYDYDCGGKDWDFGEVEIREAEDWHMELLPEQHRGKKVLLL